MLVFLAACGPCSDPVEDSSPSDESSDSPVDSEVSEPLIVPFTYDPSVTAGNPLQGFMHSYAWGEPVTDFPASLEFAYIPLAELMDGPDSFLFGSRLEPLLDAASGRGHQVVLRPYIDYPTLPSGLPDYLVGEVEQQAYSDHGGGLSPDYSDPDLRAAMTAFVAALGDAYDGDPRIAFVQIGLLGHWGEWHTWPNADWFADADVQNEVLSAYTQAFESTHVQVRYPAADSPDLRVGFHDDSFAYSTVGDIEWFFANQLAAAGAEDRWTEVPIGGELRPELQATIFQSDYQTGPYAQDFGACVEATHATYLLNHGAFGMDYETSEERERAEQAALSLGYEFTVREVNIEGDRALVRVENTGVAPFYYPLDLVLHAQEELRQELSAQPGQVIELEFTVSGRPTPDAPWRLELDSVHLLEGQRIRFANAEDQAGQLTLP